MKGPSIKLYEQIIKQYSGLHLIASGGVSHISDVVKLQEIGCSGAIIGKAIYEGTVSLEELTTFHS